MLAGRKLASSAPAIWHGADPGVAGGLPTSRNFDCGYSAREGSRPAPGIRSADGRHRSGPSGHCAPAVKPQVVPEVAEIQSR